MNRGPQQIPLFGPDTPPERASRRAEEARDGVETDPVQRTPYDADGLRLAVLGSGSRGNAIVVRSGAHTLLIDAGFSCRELEKRLRLIGVDPRQIDALVLTHEHQDHCRGADRFSKRNKVPIYATAGTLSGKRLRRLPGPVRPFRAGAELEAGGFLVRSFGVAHDAREPVGLVLEDDRGWKLGVVADLGSRGEVSWARLRDLDALVIESNHDPGMLRTGPYPWALKQRIASRWGHLSNEQAAAGVQELIGDRLGIVVLYHLSQKNNLAALAETAVGEALDRAGARARVVTCEQERPTPWLRAGGLLGAGLEGIAPNEGRAARAPTTARETVTGVEPLAPSLPGVI